MASQIRNWFKQELIQREDKKGAARQLLEPHAEKCIRNFAESWVPEDSDSSDSFPAHPHLFYSLYTASSLILTLKIKYFFFFEKKKKKQIQILCPTLCITFIDHNSDISIHSTQQPIKYIHSSS